MSEESTSVEGASDEAPDALAAPVTHSSPSEGSLLDPESADRLEAADREKPIPGGEPACPRCGTRMIRRVERHPAPRGGKSPFRVRLVCPGKDCGAWTVYDW